MKKKPDGASLPAKRNYKQETLARHRALGEKMKQLAVEKASGKPDELIQVAQFMCMFGLPYRHTAERFITRTGRGGDGRPIKATMRAMKEGVDLPFGTDRTLLHWLCDQAVRRKSSFIPLASAREFLAEVGLQPSGQNIERVIEAFDRISGFAVVVERRGIRYDATLIRPLFKKSLLPRTGEQIEAAKRGDLEQFGEKHELGHKPGITLDDDTFQEFMHFHVAAPRGLVHATMRSPKMQDYMLFLQWRSYAAQTETLIPWETLAEQFPSEDSNPRRLSEDFQGAVAALTIAWHELNARATPQGLEIGPPWRGRQLMFGGMKKRQLKLP